jgi:orotate phosphoribosyltransferase-like protein
MTKDQLIKAKKLRDKGLSHGYISGQVHAHESTVRRWLRNYAVYGDSLFTDYPTVVVQSMDD